MEVNTNEENQVTDNETVDTSVDQTTDAPTDTHTDENQDNDDFDSSAFIDTTDVNIPGGNDEPTDDSPSDTEDDDDDESTDDAPEFNWNADSEDEADTETDDSESDTDDNETVDDPADEVGSNVVIDKFKSIGIEGSSVDEIVQAVQSKLKDLEVMQDNKYTNKHIDNWKKALTLDDKELVLKNFMAEGASEEDAKNMTDSLESNNMLAQKSHEIRVAIRRSIGREQQVEKQREADRIAKQQESAERTKQAMIDHLDKTETMFGFKMGKEADLPKIRKDHFDYIQSGKFFKEVTANADILAKAAWFVRYEKQITKALMNKGTQTGKQEILDAINNPTPDDTRRISTPDGNSEFNANKFISEG